jgi:hypothetical protein
MWLNKQQGLGVIAFCTVILLLYHQCMYLSHSGWINSCTVYICYVLGHDAVQCGTYTTIWWRNVVVPSPWWYTNTKGKIFSTATIWKMWPGTVPNVKYHDDLSRLTCRNSTYLNMRWSTQNVQNGICNIFGVQIWVFFQPLLWGHFGLHQSRTETLQR